MINMHRPCDATVHMMNKLSALVNSLSFLVANVERCDREQKQKNASKVGQKNDKKM